MKSRLDLNFEISGSENRAAFVENYLSTLNFTPNEAELATIADYILWGDKGAAKAAGIDLPSRQSAKSADILSLDDLRESPAFNEASVRPITAPPLLRKRETFSREEARREAPPVILAALESLWADIDQTEAAAEDPLLSPYHRLKLKRSAIEKRRQQYGYRDFYRTKPSRFIPPTYSPPSDPDITVWPALRGNSATDPIMFPGGHPIPQKLDPALEHIICAAIWRDAGAPRQVDLTNPAHVEAILKAEELSPEELPLESIYPQILATVDYFRNLTTLTEIEQIVLRRKLAGDQNQPIAADINTQFNKTYNPNYISTIYKKSIKKIASTAELYRLHLENLFIPEAFKCCNICGETLLIHERNFMRRAASSDGFAPICKACAAARRKNQ